MFSSFRPHTKPKHERHHGHSKHSPGRSPPAASLLDISRLAPGQDMDGYLVGSSLAGYLALLSLPALSSFCAHWDASPPPPSETSEEAAALYCSLQLREGALDSSILLSRYYCSHGV